MRSEKRARAASSADRRRRGSVKTSSQSQAQPGSGDSALSQHPDARPTGPQNAARSSAVRRPFPADQQPIEPRARRTTRGPKKAKTPRNQAQLLKDIMTRNVEVIGPDESLQQAATRMDTMNIGFLPVCENDRLVGVITDRDIAVRAVAAARDSNTTLIRDIMTPDVVYTFEEQDVVQAARIMEENQVHRLIVLNSDRRLVGIVSIDDLAASPRDEKLAGLVLERLSKPIL